MRNIFLLVMAIVLLQFPLIAQDDIYLSPETTPIKEEIKKLEKNNANWLNPKLEAPYSFYLEPYAGLANTSIYSDETQSLNFYSRNGFLAGLAGRLKLQSQSSIILDIGYLQARSGFNYTAQGNSILVPDTNVDVQFDIDFLKIGAAIRYDILAQSNRYFLYGLLGGNILLPLEAHSYQRVPNLYPNSVYALNETGNVANPCYSFNLGLGTAIFFNDYWGIKADTQFGVGANNINNGLLVAVSSNGSYKPILSFISSAFSFGFVMRTGK